MAPDTSDAYTTLKKSRALMRARTRGNELFQKGDLKGACSAYTEGLGADPGNAVLLCNRAATLSKLGKWKEALRDCQLALDNHPRYTKAMKRRAQCYLKVRQGSDTWREGEQRVEVDRGVWGSRYTLALLYLVLLNY